MAHIARSIVVAAAAGYGILQVLGRRSGSTAEERSARLPGDDIVPDPQLVTNHAITINAPAKDVWPWLTQMGWHLGGYYGPEWVDRLLFPQNWASLDALDPDLLRHLDVGDQIPDGEPGTAYYEVRQAEAPHLLLLHSTTHVPPGWVEKYDAGLSWTWCFSLTDHSAGRSRLHVRVRGRMNPWWFAALYSATIVPADAIMAGGMLRGIKRRVESHPRPRVSGRPPFEAPRRPHPVPVS